MLLLGMAVAVLEKKEETADSYLLADQTYKTYEHVEVSYLLVLRPDKFGFVACPVTHAYVWQPSFGG